MQGYKGPAPFAPIWAPLKGHLRSRAPLGWAEATVATAAQPGFSLCLPCSPYLVTRACPETAPQLTTCTLAQLPLRVRFQKTCLETPG